MKSGADRYIQGFLAGQAVAYCERVNTGSGLAAQMAFPKTYLAKLIRLVAQEGCRSIIQRVNHERVSLWIYRDKLVKRLIDQMESSGKPSERDIWSTGKLFGYGDRNVVEFIERPERLKCGRKTSGKPLDANGGPESHKKGHRRFDAAASVQR